jgi:exodeoxyribonuclease V
LKNLSTDQAEVFRIFFEWLESDSKEFRLGGLAGTGKTTIVKRMLENLSSFSVITFTAKAAAVLKEKGVDASTYHSLLKRFEREIVNADGSISLVFSDNKVTLDFIIVDEASMVTGEMRQRILNCGNRVIWVGDYGQLPPVEIGSPFEKGVVDEDLLDAKLTQQHRHSGSATIIDFASFVREGNSPNEFNACDNSVLINPTQGRNVRDIAEYFVKNKITQAICATNNGCLAFNREIRKVMYREKPIECGERIMCIRNNQNYDIANGQIFTVLGGDGGTVKTECGKVFHCTFDTKHKGQNKVVIDYGYAITCHKAQGSEWPSVCVIEEIPSVTSWRYTAATRAMNKLVYFISEDK